LGAYFVRMIRNVKNAYMKQMTNISIITDCVFKPALQNLAIKKLKNYVNNAIIRAKLVQAQPNFNALHVFHNFTISLMNA